MAMAFSQRLLGPAIKIKDKGIKDKGMRKLASAQGLLGLRGAPGAPRHE